MNRSLLARIVGRILLIGAACMVPSLALAVADHSPDLKALAVTIGIMLALGGASFLIRASSDIWRPRDALGAVTFSWLAISAFGALPFTLSGYVPNYIDAFFETVSGFTTTGASILRDVESMRRSMLFWRSFTHWIGGMGVLVLMVAVMPNLSGRTIHVLRAEMPGPTMGKLSPKLKDTAKILYLIYIAMTLLELILLVAGGMPLFDSAIHTFGTAGTGGFSLKADSLAGYSPYLQWVVATFMMLFGINFNLYFLLVMRRFRTALRSEELWTYLGIIFASTALICWNVMPLFEHFSDAVRHAFFQVNTISSTTGFSTVNFDDWPTLSRMIMVLLMFSGACAGSTAGGLKISRVVLLFKTVRREIRHMLHPRTVTSVRFEGKPMDSTTLISVISYFAIYIGLFAGFWFLVSFQPGFDGVSNFSAVAACYNNIGPGLNLVGPTLGYWHYTPFIKIVLAFAMLFGRLEIYPMLISLSPSTWKR